MYVIMDDEHRAYRYKRYNRYNRRQMSFNDIKQKWRVCPKCGNEDLYYINHRTGNGLYNCDYCGYAAHERKFMRPRFKVRKCIMRHWRIPKQNSRRRKERRKTDDMELIAEFGNGAGAYL
jgi:predicted RNA-binding Zn-ribbon protein involved in translation (DUF1610 family)